MTFAATFRDLVTPHLRALCEREALAIAWSDRSFAAAYATVMREAGRRGALHLPDHIQAELDAWVCHTLCLETDKHMAAVTEQERVSAKVGADVLRHEILMARHFAAERVSDDLASGFADGALAALA